MPDAITSSKELLRRLLDGQQLVECYGIGLTIGADAAPVPDMLVRGLRGATFRLELGGDGLPGIGRSQTMRLERIATSEDLLHRLRSEIRAAGSLSAFARQHGASKGAIANVEGCTLDMTAGVAALMGMTRVTNLWVPVARGGRA
jgi:hypothetical protein